MKGILLIIVLLNLTTISMAQSSGDLPYAKIPDYPETYTAGTVLSRMVDGLGFRYYWATDQLRPEDLNFKPSAEARTTMETMEHIYSLTQVILNATIKSTNDNRDTTKYAYDELRARTLNNLKRASEILLKSSNEEVESYKIIFGTREYPFWNNINGPIADAIWHVGQIVSFRRSSGNPFNSKVSVFNGYVRD